MSIISSAMLSLLLSANMAMASEVVGNLSTGLESSLGQTLTGIVTAPVTPATTNNTTGGGSHRGGGSSGSSSSFNNSTSTGHVLGASTFRFGHNLLRRGNRNDDVKTLQAFLINKDVGLNSKQLATFGTTGYFGPVTMEALIEYQKSIKFGPYAGWLFPKLSRFIANQINVS